mmetsp:Transcript_81829/g.227923  ORF Transcript_81829/g.227923 Transcript_81829/m.227923 type:complete len:267 (+) Transcript_81829:2281-3081(+)
MCSRPALFAARGTLLNSSNKLRQNCASSCAQEMQRQCNAVAPPEPFSVLSSKSASRGKPRAPPSALGPWLMKFPRRSASARRARHRGDSKSSLQALRTSLMYVWLVLRSVSRSFAMRIARSRASPRGTSAICRTPRSTSRRFAKSPLKPSTSLHSWPVGHTCNKLSISSSLSIKSKSKVRRASQRVCIETGDFLKVIANCCARFASSKLTPVLRLKIFRSPAPLDTLDAFESWKASLSTRMASGRNCPPLPIASKIVPSTASKGRQ